MTAPRPRVSGGEIKSEEAFRTIGEVAETLELPQHVLRFWESRFSQLRPLKRGGNRRYYRPEDVALLRAIKTLLYEEGFTIKGVQKRFREQGVKATVEAVLAQQEPPPVALGSATTALQDETQDASSGEVRRTDAGTEDRRADLAEILEELRALRRLLD